MKTLLTLGLLAIIHLSVIAEENRPIHAAPVADASITISPKDSAYPGKKWMTRKFKIKNISGQDFFVIGDSLDHLFFQIFTKEPKTGEWTNYGLGFCGTGARAHTIKSGSTFTVSVSLPIEISNRDFVIEFDRHIIVSRNSSRNKKTRTLPLRMKSSKKASSK